MKNKTIYCKASNRLETHSDEVVKFRDVYYSTDVRNDVKTVVPQYYILYLGLFSSDIKDLTIIYQNCLT